MALKLSTYTISDSVLEIVFQGKIDFSISNFLGLVLKNIKGKKVRLHFLNFDNTEFITLPGALFIISFCKYLSTTERQLIKSEITKLNISVFPFLLSIGFFSTLRDAGKFFIDQDILSEEEKLVETRQHTETSIVLPICIIVYSPDKSYFTGYTKKIVNLFGKFFYTLTKYKLYNYSDTADESQELFDAFHENIKNIFDHSQSDGFGAIHASSYLKGTTLTFFDAGIGIARSVLHSKPLDINSKIEAIIWAFEDGRTSKPERGNQGHGFQIFKQFCDQRNGILTVRTDQYLFVYKQKEWKSQEVEWFPGTQVILYNPTI